MPVYSKSINDDEDSLADDYDTSAGGGGGAFNPGPYNGATVFYGMTSRNGRGSGGRIGEIEATPAVPLFITPAEAYEDYFRTWTPQQRSDLRAKGILSGQLQEGAGDRETSRWWLQLVQQAAKYGAAGQQVSPFALAQGYLDAAGGMTDQERFKQQRGSFPSGAIFDSSGKYTRTYRDGQFIVNELTGQRTYVGPKFKTTTDTRVDFTDPATARALTESIFQQLVGRNPGAGELGQFAAALSTAEAAAPTTTNTTSEYNDLGEVVSQQSTTAGGLSEAGKQQLMKERLREKPEYGVYQAATTYANATKRAIWGGPGA